VADAMPLVGLPVGMIPAVLMALTLSPTKALVVAVSYIVYHQFETTVLIPRLYSKSMNLSGSVILIAILMGGQLMGVVGALLALPVAAAIPLILRYIGQWRDRQADRHREAERQPAH
jgi:predicted PurR-regulated permease PerM